MNEHIKQIVKKRLEFLETQEQEIESFIEKLKEKLIKEEETLKKIREEKNALKEE